MNLHTAYKNKENTTDPDKPVIQLDGVGVQYRTPQDRIPALKEYAIQWIKGNISYKSLWALKDISLKIHPGEVLGIIGPNGAGKSTLLKVVARVLIPTEGRVRIRGRISPLLELGAGFDLELTGRENIYLNGTTLGFAKHDIDDRFDRIVDFAGLKDFINAPVRTYSTGMVARLGFSVATDVRPEILIVDEILGVGDAEFQTKSFERIQSFQAAGTTILLVTHDLGKVIAMCSRVVWLDEGEIASIGSAEAVTSQYLSETEIQEAKRLAQKNPEAAAAAKAAAEAEAAAEAAAAAEAEADDKSAPERWGNKKIEFIDVRILNENSGEQTIFHTGEKLILEMNYIAHERIKSPIFGIAIHRQDGVHITGPNTSFAGVGIPTVEGEGKVVYTIPYLPMLEGLYHFSVAATNQNDTETFDYHDKLYSFRVSNRGQNEEQYGLLTLSGKWKTISN